MQLRAFWTPLPNWVYGAIPAVVGALIGIIAFGSGEIASAALIGAVVGFFGGSILWGIIGVIGGDLLEVEFDLANDIARVRQSALWIINRRWSFDLYDIVAVETTRTRPRPILLQFVGRHYNWLRMEDGSSLRIGQFPTDIEADAVAEQVADFIGVALQRED